MAPPVAKPMNLNDLAVLWTVSIATYLLVGSLFLATLIGLVSFKQAMKAFDRLTAGRTK